MRSFARVCRVAQLTRPCLKTPSSLQRISCKLGPSRPAWSSSLHTTSVSLQSASEPLQRLPSERVKHITDDISKLSVLEVVDLVQSLQKLFGFSDADIRSSSSSAGAAPAASAPAASAAPAAPAAKVEKTSFTVKLKRFADKDKIMIIKQVRVVTGLGLKQAKDLVESAPCVIKEAVPKEEAEKMLATIKEAGGEVELE